MACNRGALAACLAMFMAAGLCFPVLAAEVPEKPRIPAGKVTFDFQGVNILDVLKLLSKRSGLNIVAGKNVQGQVSLFIQEVDVRDALATILEISGLAYVEERGMIKVMTQKDYEDVYGKPYQDVRQTRQFGLSHARAESLAETLNQMKSPFGRILVESRTNTLVITDTPDLLREMESLIRQTDMPSVSRTFALKYAKAEDLEAKLTKIVLQGQGSLEIDKRSNRIFVKDTPARVRHVENVVKAFDIRQPQVLIQAKVIEVRLSDEYRFGIDWQLVVDTVGSLNTLKGAAAYAVAPPAGATLTTLSLGSGLDDLQTVIQALSKMGKTNTLSSPRLTVINQEEAKLAVATREPFVSQTVVQSVNTSTTADNVQFVDVGVTLRVTPSISEDHFIQMKIKPEISTAGTPLELQGVSQGSNTAFTRTRVPVVTTQELETTVMVKSGTTLVIGGLIQDKKDNTEVKLPVLGSIPFLGRAFSSRSRDSIKNELVIFITPTEIDPSISSGESPVT